jgi:hypothetical protein
MAKQSNTDEENKKLKEQIELLKQRLGLQQESFDLSSSIVDSLREALGIEIRRSTMEKSTLKANQDINSAILNQKTGLSDINTIQKQIIKNEDLIKKGKLIENSLLSSIGDKLSKNGNIVEGRIKKQAQQNKQLAEYNKRIEEGLSIDVKSYEALKEKMALNEESLAQEFGKLSSLEQQYILTKQNTKALEDQQKVREAEKGIQDQLETQLGLSGKLAKALGAIPGIGNASAKALEEVTKELQAQVEAGGKLPSRWKTFGMLIEKTFKSLGKGLTDPLIILGYLSEVDKGAGNLAKSMNMTYQEALDTRKELGNIATLSGDTALNTKNLQETLMFVGKQLGSNVKLNEADLKIFTKLREQAGLTNEEIMGAQNLSLANGKTLEQNTKQFLAQGKITGLNNKVLLNEKDLYREINNISAATTLSLGKNPQELAKAAATAKALGIEMSKLEDISNSLLQFESSIESELSAELLTGKDINLERARLLALNNDIAGMAEEINNQIGSSSDFTNMNVIQQEALAKAVGMNREELAKTLLVQEQLKNFSGDEAEKAKAALNARIEETSLSQVQKELEEGSLETLMNQQSIQERIIQGVDKLKDVFMQLAVPILDAISPLIDMVSTILPAINLLLQPLITGFQFVGTLVSTIFGVLTKFKPLLIAVGLALAPMAINALITAASMIMSAFSVIPVVGPILGATFVAGTLWGMADTAIGLVKGNDIMSPGESGGGYGKRTLFGPEGAIQLNDKDTVIAGTNLFDKETNSTSNSPQVMSVSNSTAPRRESTVDPNVGMNARLDKLISVTERVNTISTLRVQ